MISNGINYRIGLMWIAILRIEKSGHCS